LRDLYPDYEICFGNINQDSLLFSALKGDSFRPQTICAKIEFASSSYDEYFKSLSKHQRQNIRTGYNKLSREEITWRIEKFDAANPMPRGVWKQCLRMYNERCNMKNKRANGLKRYWVEWKNSQVDLMNILIRKWNRVVSFVMFMDEQPVAYMSGMYNNQHDTFYVPRLSCSNSFLRYDTGILMLNESIKLLLADGVRTIDLTRGDEHYKFAMGAVAHTNYVLHL
jgi:predicted N-acyltransferase